MYATIQGLYKYNPNLFNGLNVPTGMVKDDLINEILMATNDLGVLYIDPELMQYMIGHWSTVNQSIWTKLLATTNFTYNPIHNVDATEETQEGSSGNSVTSSGSSGSRTDKMAAYNETTPVTTGEQESEDEAHSGTASNSNRNMSLRRYGNIGVTSTQQLIKQEREVDMFNIYETIAEDFKKKFCLLIY